MGVIRDAAGSVTELDLSGRYDPSLIHWWEEVRPRGEWPTTVIAPACTPRERRTVSTEMVDANHHRTTDPAAGVVSSPDRCPMCVAIVGALS